MRGRTATVVVVVAGMAGLLGGCGGDGISIPSGTISLPSATITLPGNETPTETATATSTNTVTVTPTPTEEPTEEPTETASPSGEAAAPADEEDGGLSPWWLVLLGLVVLIAIIWYMLAQSSRRRRAQQELLAGLESRGRWAVDHGVGALIGAGDPGATQEAWSRLNATLVDMAGEVRKLAHQVPADQGATVIGLRDAVASLQGAAESHARARLSGDPSPTTAEAVFAARDRLSRALAEFHTPTA